MLYSRISSGLDFLDAATGGLYSKRSYLMHGPSQSGRTTAVLQFLLAGIENGENGILISSDRIENVILKAETIGIPLEAHLMANRLVLMEYPKEILSGKFHYGTIIQLLGEFEQYIQHYNCSRLAFDTLLPLLTMAREPHLVNYIYSLMNSLEALGVTVLVTTGEPNSPTAQRITQLIEDATVGSFALSRVDTRQGMQRFFAINKLVDKFTPPMSFRVKLEYASGLAQDIQSEMPSSVGATASVSLTEVPLRVGVLDADDDSLMQLEETFNKHSEIIPFEAVEDLVAQMGGLDCDLFFINISRPGVLWQRALKMLRESYPKMTIFLFSEERTMRFTYQQAKLAGADALFFKPFVPNDIIRALEKSFRAYGSFDDVVARRSDALNPIDLPVDLAEGNGRREATGASALLQPAAFRELVHRQIWKSNQAKSRCALVSFKTVYMGELPKIPNLPQGLELVMRVAQIITASLRGASDCASRYMDKVVVVLEDSDRKGAQAFARRVIGELRAELLDKLNLQLEKHVNVLTAIAVYPEDADNVNDLMYQVTDVSRNFLKTVA
jgi:KaiC/GvpD/RAD55 family RecA-like ATPase/GGDEF domain-containing protein/DNA-binding NarL/FixJ family response regulator